MAERSSNTMGAPVEPILATISRIDALPFVGRGARGRCHWQVSPSGDYEIDCEQGEAWAHQALDVQSAARFPHLIAWVLADMMEKTAATSGLEIGFLSVIARRCALACVPKAEEKAA